MSAGAGRSAVYARRIRTISAAAAWLGARAISSRPLSSICQARDKIATDSRSASDAAAPPLLGRQALAGRCWTQRLGAGGDVHGVGEIGQHLRRLGAVAMQARRTPRAPRRRPAQQLLDQIEDAPAVGEAQHVAHALGARPCRRPWRAPGRAATARRAPSPRRRGRSAPAPRPRRSPPSLATIFRKCSASTGTSTRRRSKRWQRDSTVTRHLAHLGGGEDELHVARAAPPASSAAR